MPDLDSPFIGLVKRKVMKEIMRMNYMKEKLISVFLLSVIYITLGFCISQQAYAINVPDYDLLLREELRKDILDTNKIVSLIEKGANPNYIDVNGRSISILGYLLMRTIDVQFGQINEHELIVIMRALIDHGLKIQWCDKKYFSIPISSGCKQFVEELLKLGFDPSKPLNGELPIDIAEKNGYSEIVKLLVKYGAVGNDLSDIAQLKLVQAAFNSNIKEMENAIKDGALVDKDDKSGRYALIEALKKPNYTKEQYDTIIYLLLRNADPNHLAESGFEGMGKVPALYMAVFTSSIAFRMKDNVKYKDCSIYARDILTELIKAGAYVSGKTEKGQTPLHVAAQFNNIEAANILLKSGAKIMPKDDSGNTPLDYAESAEMIKLLKDYGAKETVNYNNK